MQMTNYILTKTYAMKLRDYIYILLFIFIYRAM